ncbi:dCMP deaminase [Pseudomonas phage Almagne]|nr:dCMP deaminase [Pseudomonas phage Almagne]
MFIEMAHTAAKRGTCNRLKVGAVIAVDSRPISMGYNGTPPGAAHCGPECTMANPCTKTLHAEANAIHWAQKNEPNYGAYGATIYVTDSPCKACAILIHLAGISRVVYDRAYRIRDGIEYLESHGIEVIQCHVKPATNAN